MGVHVADDAPESADTVDHQRIERLVETVLRGEGAPGRVDVVLAGDTLLAQLNKSYRDKSGPTDVLSFPLESTPEDDLIGEVYVSMDRAQVQANDYHATLPDELARLVIHGALHVLGHDHVEDEERARMEKRERLHLSGWEEESSR